jgi:hypothetical protein
MGRLAGIAAVLLGLALPAVAGAAGLTANSLGAAPPSVLPYQVFTLQLDVSNGSASDLTVSANLAWVDNGFMPVQLSGPTPSGQVIASGFHGLFSWTFSGTACGDAVFSASASAPSAALNSNTVTATVQMVCTTTPTESATSTPTPTAGASDTSTPTASPTPTPGSPAPTATRTPEFSPTPAATAPPTVVVTATPAPLLGTAVILGNIYHPLQGGTMTLQFNEPYASAVDIDLYDRVGRLVRHMELNVGPGVTTTEWDGRDNDGVTVASGIYVAYFHGKGLSSLLKFAVIK